MSRTSRPVFLSPRKVAPRPGNYRKLGNGFGNRSRAGGHPDPAVTQEQAPPSEGVQAPGAPATTRTRNLGFRRALLYPIELLGPNPTLSRRTSRIISSCGF